MKIDNFKIIRSLLEFRSDDDFYFCQILQRKKENPDLPKSVKLIKTFYIDSFEKLDRYENQIKKLCTDHNARAYININRRSYRKVALGVLRETARYVSEDTFKPVMNVYDKICGQLANETSDTKKWVLDFDVKSDQEEKLKKYILEKLFYTPPSETDKAYAIVPTLNGFHIISRPFDSIRFREMFTYVKIHKNNPTILTA